MYPAWSRILTARRQRGGIQAQFHEVGRQSVGAPVHEQDASGAAFPAGIHQRRPVGVIGHHEANKADAENAKAQAPVSPSRGDGKN